MISEAIGTLVHMGGNRSSRDWGSRPRKPRPTSPALTCTAGRTPRSLVAWIKIESLRKRSNEHSVGHHAGHHPDCCNLRGIDLQRTGPRSNVAKGCRSNIDVLLKQRADERPSSSRSAGNTPASNSRRYACHRCPCPGCSSARERHDLPHSARRKIRCARPQPPGSPWLRLTPSLYQRAPHMQLQTRIAALRERDRIAGSGTNESAKLQNIRIEQFPDLIVARLFRFGSTIARVRNERETRRGHQGLVWRLNDAGVAAA